MYNSIPTLIYFWPTVKMNQRQIVVYHIYVKDKRRDITPCLKAGDCGWVVYVGGMSEDQLEGLQHGQEIVVR